MVKELLILAIFSTLAIIAWIASNVYHNFTTSTISRDTEIQIAPITPTFDNDVLQNIAKRNSVVVDLTAKSLNSAPQPSSPTASELQPSPATSSSGSATIESTGSSGIVPHNL